ncbi:MAG: 2-hydroxychromene-2-carboxylate isomerase [Hyphomonadaceae bacterium]
MSHSVRVDAFYDCASPWSYIAFERLSAVAAQRRFTVDWRPVVVGGVFSKANPNFVANRAQASAAKVAYTNKDIADWAADTGIAMVFPPENFPVNSVNCMRVCLAAGELGLLPQVSRAFFSAYFQDNRDISNPKVISQVLIAHGAPEKLIDLSQSEIIRRRLIANCDELVERGGFGVPTMFLSSDMYFGADRIWLLLKAIERQGGVPASERFVP